MKRYSTIMSVLLTLALPVAGSCADATKAPEKTDATVEAVKDGVAKPAHSMTGISAPQAATAELSNPSGKVVETMDAGGYTYASLEKDGKNTWVAFSTLETRVGETLSFHSCMAMQNFQSKALNRKFDSVLFCGPPEVSPEAAAKKAAAKKAAKKAAIAAAASGKIEVAKASGANAYNVAEVFAKRGTLNGKQIVVKGQVVKVSSGIMARNWLHLQDGSGSEQKKTNDLVVTTQEMAEVGDVVTVSGTVVKDKNFGSGYKYDVMIEQGSVKK